MVPRALGGEGIDPVALAYTRMLAGAVFFVGFSSVFGLRTKTTRADQLRLAGLSLLGITINQTLFLVGLRSTTPVSAALLGVTIPVFTAALSVLLRVERSSVRLWAGLALAVFGVIWLTGVRSIDRGAVLVTMNSISYSAYVVLSQGMVRRLGPMTVITWIFVWGAALFTPYALPRLAADVPSWTSRGFVLAAWIVATPTIVAYLFNAWALGKSQPSLVTVYICLQPLFAGGLAWAQLGQPPPPRALFAAVAIIAGVAIVATRRISGGARTSLRE